MLSARVIDPQLLPLWIANPQGQEDPQERKVDFFCIENHKCFVLCPRGFAIPESVIADMLSARVKDPQLFPLWIANPQEREAIDPQKRKVFLRVHAEGYPVIEKGKPHGVPNGLMRLYLSL